MVVAQCLLASAAAGVHSLDRAIGSTCPPAATTGASSAGDCDDDGVTSVDELVRGVGIALGAAPLDGCPAADLNGDGTVTVDELVRAVAAALTGPPPQPFANPERVTIRGYDATAMEPFVSRDGRYLFFNNSNASSVDTNLYYAQRIDDVAFEYRGEIGGVNTSALDAVASMDRQGRFYFVSTRSYADTLSTIYAGSFADGVVGDVELVRGVSMEVAGQVNFDAEISPDGATLYFVDGVFAGGALPAGADLAIAVRRGGGFERLTEGPALLANVNTDALEYAPSVSANGLELFFTRRADALPAIYRSVRCRVDAPFGVPEPVDAIDGFAEAPSLSGDGRSLYYHRRDGDRFAIYRVTR
jgi:hypothetical protein